MKRLSTASWLLTILALRAAPGFAQAQIRLDDAIRVHVFSRPTRACLNRFSPRRWPTLESIVKTRKTIWILDYRCSEASLAELDRFLEMQYHLSLYMTEPEIREYKHDLQYLKQLPPVRAPDLDSWVERTELSFRAVVHMESPYAVHKIKEIYRLTHDNLSAMPRSVADEIYRLARKYRITIYRNDRERLAFFEGRLDADRRPLRNLGLSPRCLKVLNLQEIWNVDDLDEASRGGELESIPNFGPKCRELLHEALGRHGWTLTPPDTQHLGQVRLDPKTRAALFAAHVSDVPRLRARYLGGRLFEVPGIDLKGVRAIERVLGIDLPHVPYTAKIALVRHGIRTMEGLKNFSVVQAVMLGLHEEVSVAYRLHFGRDLYFDPLDRDIAEENFDHLLKVSPYLKIRLAWSFGIRTVGDLLKGLGRRDPALLVAIDEFEPEMRARIEKRAAKCAIKLTEVTPEDRK